MEKISIASRIDKKSFKLDDELLRKRLRSKVARKVKVSHKKVVPLESYFGQLSQKMNTRESKYSNNSGYQGHSDFPDFSYESSDNLQKRQKHSELQCTTITQEPHNSSESKKRDKFKKSSYIELQQTIKEVDEDQDVDENLISTLGNNAQDDDELQNSGQSAKCQKQVDEDLAEVDEDKYNWGDEENVDEMEEDADESQNVDEMDDDAEESYPLQFVCDAIKLIRGLKLQNIEDPVIRRELIHLNYIIETSIQRRGVNQNAGYVQEMPKTYINHPVKKIQEYLNKVSEGITLDNSPQVTFSRILIAAYASASKSLATDIQLTSCLSTLEVIDVVLSTQQQKLQQKFKSFFVSYLNTEIKRVSKEFAINMKSEDNKKDHIFVHKLPGLTFTRDVNDRIEKVRIKKMLEKETETRIAKDRKIARTAKQFGQQDIMQRRQNQK